MARTKTLKMSDRKVSYTVSLTPRDRNKLVKEYKSLTLALNSLLDKLNEDDI